MPVAVVVPAIAVHLQVVTAAGVLVVEEVPVIQRV
jgi:hypothetical protein